MSGEAILHASLIARHYRHHWHGVLLLGPSGAGKSHLALKAVRAGWRLVADDRVVVWAEQASAYGRAPDPLSGLIEVRGLGVIKAPAPVLAFCQIRLTALLSPAKAAERWPDARYETVAGLKIAALTLDPFCELSLSKLSLALEHLPVGE
jgi:serine kinase of HPr protein (carbohydrate metabolism regulator)